MDEREFEFLKFYIEQTWEENRHLESLRERVTILVITLASAIIGFIVQQKFASETKIFNLIIIILGLFGFAMTLKIFQIHQKGQRRLDKWYGYLNSYCGTNPQILILRDQADNENKFEFPRINPIRHHYFWSALNISIALIGLSLYFFKPAEKEKTETQNINLIIKSAEKTDTLKIKHDTLKIIKK